MKKVLPILICISIIVCAFAACSSSKNDDDSTSSVETTAAITTDEAKIKDGDAIRLIESYSDDELGISSQDRKECTFMVNGSGTKIDKNYYVKVIAAVKTEHQDGDEVSYTFDNKGEYFIRYDGKEILSMDMETGEYSKMEVKDVPTTEAPTSHTQTTKK
jgi:uncharacterized protein YxeA